MLGLGPEKNPVLMSLGVNGVSFAIQCIDAFRGCQVTRSAFKMLLVSSHNLILYLNWCWCQYCCSHV